MTKVAIFRVNELVLSLKLKRQKQKFATKAFFHERFRFLARNLKTRPGHRAHASSIFGAYSRGRTIEHSDWPLLQKANDM